MRRSSQKGIAGDILRELTDADLRELGLNLGDRKRLLKAIAALPAELSMLRPLRQLRGRRFLARPSGAS